MELAICAWVIHYITFAINLWAIEGNQSFFDDFLNHFDADDPLFICSDEFEQDIGSINNKSTTGFVIYTKNKEEEQVLHQLHQLFLLGDLTMVVFIDDGHHKLLDQLINDLQLFNKGLRGLISEFDITMSFSFSLHLDTQLYIYAPEGETISLKEAYGVNGNTKVEIVGTWKDSTGLIVPTSSIWERRRNLEGLSIRVATMSFPPMQNLYYDTSGQSIIGCGGLFLDPMNILASKLNFTVNFMIPGDGAWGALTTNGTWTGMIGMLIKDEVDIAAADLSATEARQRVVKFSNAIAEEVVTLVAAPSGETEANSWIYFEIFPYSAWYLCSGMILVLSTCFYVVDSTGINVLHGQFDSEKFSFMNGMGLSLTFFRQIYYNVNIKCKSTKLLFILSALSTYLLYIHYVAYLTAASTHTKTNKISSFWDVISGEYQVSVWKYGVFHDLLRYANRGTAMGEVYHKTMKNRPSAFIESIVDLRKLLASEKTSKKTLIYAGDLYLKSQYENLQYLNIQVLIEMNKQIIEIKSCRYYDFTNTIFRRK